MRIAFLFPAFPVLHQTFVLGEVLALRDRGVAMDLYSLKRPAENLQQKEAVALRKEVHYSPRLFSPAVLRANVRSLRRSPGRYARAYLRLIAQWWNDRGLTAPRGKAPPNPDLHDIVRRRERVSARLNTSPFLYLLRSLCLVPLAVHLGEELRHGGITHLHAHWASYPATVAAVIRWIFDIPFSFTAHAYDIYLVPRLLPVKIRDAEFVVTCARVNAEYLAALAGGEYASRIVVNYHGVDLEHFRPPERPGPRTQAMPVLTTCGGLLLYKGHHVLLRACALMSEPAKCVVIGDGPMRRSLESLARDLGIANRVEFTGAVPREEVIRIYGETDLFVLASIVIEETGRRDVIPNVLVEAMAMGLPVVGTRLSGIAELIEDGKTGCLVPPNDPRTLAETLDGLIADPDRCRRLGEEARRRVRDEFDRSKNALALARLFLDRAHGDGEDASVAKSGSGKTSRPRPGVRDETTPPAGHS